MTDATPHRATAEQWTLIADTSYAYLSSAILELRARIKALEEQVVDCNYQHRKRIVALEARATCPHYTSDQFCELAKQTAAEPAPPEPAPDGSLVEAVVDAITDAAAAYGTADEPARAAIRAMAEALRAQCFVYAADWLEQEAKQ